MKKKTLFLMLGMAAMLASCSQDDLSSGQGGKTMTITANIDNGMLSRVSTYDNDDVEINQCLMEIYDSEGNPVGTQVEGTKGTTEGQFTFTVAGLDPDVNYDFVFWADNKAAAAYTGNLKARALSSTADLSKALAFQGKIENSLVEKATSVTLTHAVAKVSLKTTGAMASGDKVDMTVNKIANTWNVETGEMSGEASPTYSYTLTSAITENQEGSEVTTFYVPAPTAGSVADLTLKFTKSGESEEATTINNVPLKANFRTLLKGNVAMINTVEANITTSLNETWSDQESGEILVPASNTIVTTKAGEITADKVKRAAEFDNGNVVVKGPVNSDDLKLFAAETAPTINSLDLSDAKIFNNNKETTIFGTYFNGKTHVIRNIILPGNITEIANNAFSRTTNLSSVVFPFKLEKIGTSAFAFTSLSGEIVIPETITSIGESAFEYAELTSVIWNSNSNMEGKLFYGCDKLTEVTINGNVTSISDDAFGDQFKASTLKTLTVNVTTPPTITTSSTSKEFKGVNSLTAIYVPADAVDNYKAADGWKEHADIIKAIGTE